MFLPDIADDSHYDAASRFRSDWVLVYKITSRQRFVNEDDSGRFAIISLGESTASSYRNPERLKVSRSGIPKFDREHLRLRVAAAYKIIRIGPPTPVLQRERLYESSGSHVW